MRVQCLHLVLVCVTFEVCMCAVDDEQWTCRNVSVGDEHELRDAMLRRHSVGIALTVTAAAVLAISRKTSVCGPNFDWTAKV
jgi:hypothetical protein